METERRADGDEMTIQMTIGSRQNRPGMGMQTKTE
jgi:hypothetical protein